MAGQTLQLLYSERINLEVICALLHRYGSGWNVGGDCLIGWGKTAVLMALFCLIMAVIVIAVLTSVYCTA